MKRIQLAALAALALPLPADAMVGGAPPAGPELTRHILMIVGSRGSFCTGAAVARDLVLTAAHCVMPGADYKVIELDAQRQPKFRDVATIARHPQFDINTLNAHRATADVALLKLAEPLPASFVPAPLASPARPVAVGDRYMVAGFGLTTRGDGRTGGTLRSAALTTTGQPGTLQIRLFDPATKNQRAGLGACTGDSGAPAFVLGEQRLSVAGVVSWSTGPGNSAGCGGLTGVTPLVRYKDWIVDTARKLGSALAQ